MISDCQQTFAPLFRTKSSQLLRVQSHPSNEVGLHLKTRAYDMSMRWAMIIWVDNEAKIFMSDASHRFYPNMLGF